MVDGESELSNPGSMQRLRVTAVIVAAGRGERFGTAAKCLVPLMEQPILAHSLDTIDAASTIDDVVIVAGEHTQRAVEQLVASGRWRKPIQVVSGGAVRQLSVALGVARTALDVDVVVIHDAARPLAGPDLFDQCVRAAAEFGAAITACPVVDTIKRIADGRIIETVPREDLWSAQTPQAFRRDRLIAALDSDTASAQSFTDEAGLFEAHGWTVHVVPGDTTNIKITRPEDVLIAAAILATRAATVMSDAVESVPEPAIP